MLTIRWPVGRSIVQAIGELADKFFSFAYVGAKVTYGHELIDNYGVFAFKVSIDDLEDVLYVKSFNVIYPTKTYM